MVWVLTEGSLLVVINFETSFFISLSSLFTMPLMAAEDNSSMLSRDLRQLTPFSILSTNFTNCWSLVGDLRLFHEVNISHTLPLKDE